MVLHYLLLLPLQPACSITSAASGRGSMQTPNAPPVTPPLLLLLLLLLPLHYAITIWLP
jgi:hypothetical protein